MADELPKCFDAYLRYAIASEFKNFDFFDEQDSKLFLFVELKAPKLVDDFEAAMRSQGGEDYGAEFGPISPTKRYLTMRASKAAVGPRSFPIWNDNVSRVELSLPIQPANAKQIKPRAKLRDRSMSKDAPAPLLIGVIDDGCPFAAAQYLNAALGDPTKTRVRGIWDQNPQRSPVPVPNVANTVFGEKLPDFGYGVEFLRDPASGKIPTATGLDDWIARHSSDGTIDEDSCYADAGFKTLKYRCSHGAHVTDVIAGRVPPSSRVVRSDPPSWQPGDPLTDPASHADIVFVQLPENCLRDATGVWLKAYVADALDYILSFVDTRVTKVAINLSYGPTTGPHDGTAELERKLRDLVSKYDGSSGCPQLDIFLPAGNSYLSEGHIRFVRQSVADRDHIEWTWYLPPDNTVLCFAEVWMKKRHTRGVIVTLTSPSGLSSSSVSGPNLPLPGSTSSPTVPFLPPYTGSYAPVVWGDNRMWLVAVGPTITGTGTVIEHGNWKIKVEGIDTGQQVHAYVARTDPNLNMRTGAKRSYFVDAVWKKDHAAGASFTYGDGEFDETGSLVCRLGTLNGIATDQVAGLHVAGGYILSHPTRKSPYASAGPARPGASTLRVGPDYALFCDESHTLQGVRAGGNRSGVVFRLIGTSAAAPQFGRQIADGRSPAPHDVPANPPDEKRGYGDFDPP